MLFIVVTISIILKNDNKKIELDKYNHLKKQDFYYLKTIYKL